MTTSICPRCHETFRIPASGVSATAYGQCPWCHESFPLAEVLDRLPPMLTIVSATGAEGAVDGASGSDSWVESDQGIAPDTHSEPQAAVADLGTIDAGQDLVDRFELDSSNADIGETVALRETVDFASADTNQLAIDAQSNVDSAVTRETAVQVRPTKRKKSGGSLRSLVGIALGGLLAVPVAGAIMWAFGFGYFEQDDFADYRVSSPPAPSATEPASISSSEEPVISDSEPSDTPPEPPAVGDIAASRTNTGSSLSMPEEAIIDETANLDSSTSDSLSAVSELPNSDSIESVVPAPEPDSDELINTVDLATKMILALNSLDPDDEKRPGWLTKTYQRISAAADSAGVNSPAMTELADAIKQSSLVADFEIAGGDWMDFTGRSNDGVLLIGQTDGMVLSLNSGKSISISGPLMLPSSGRAIVLGRILDSATVEAVVIESM